MKTTLLSGLAALAALAFAAPAAASRDEALCEVHSSGQARAEASGPCTYREVQGVVYIELRNGRAFQLKPAGERDRYRDLDGKRVVRVVLAAEGRHEYRWERKRVIVYLPERRPDRPGEAVEVTVRCSARVPSHDSRCRGTVERRGKDLTALRLRFVDGRERVLEFRRDGAVTTPGSDRVAATREADDWYVRVNDREFYRIPHAVLRGR